jgi:pimeloyl-ACP methyl ester carboxylesterase
VTHIFLHGLGQDSSSWDKTASCLTDSFPVDCPDLFALLGSNEKDYQNLYTAFSNYCNSKNAPLHLCGLSLGGVLALDYSINNPDKVKSLVLIASQYKMPKNLLKLQNILFRFMPESAFKSMGLSKKEVINLTKSMMDLDFNGKLCVISCPVMLICGSKDKANIKASKELESRLSGAILNIVDNTGHEVNKDAPENLAMLLSKFYQNK